MAGKIKQQALSSVSNPLTKPVNSDFERPEGVFEPAENFPRVTRLHHAICRRKQAR